jgi:subtilisin family serine protease
VQMAGTSASAPYAAGVAALMKSADPSSTVDRLGSFAMAS